MGPFGGMFQCLWDGSCESLAMNVPWHRKLVSKERKGLKCRWWGPGQWLVLGGIKRVCKKRKMKLKQVFWGITGRALSINTAFHSCASKCPNLRAFHRPSQFC